MLTPATYAPLFATTGYTILLVILLIRKSELQAPFRWFLGYLAVSALWNLILFFFITDGVLPELFLVLLLVGNVLLGVTTSYYVDWSNQRRWLMTGSLAIFTLAMLALFLPQAIPARPSNLIIQPSLSGLLGIVLWLFIAMTLIGRSWLSYRATHLPWHANRLLHWTYSLLFTFLGEALIFIDDPAMMPAGQTLRFIGVLSLSHALSSHRLFDVKSRLRHTLAYAVIVIATLIPAGFLLWVLNSLTPNLELPTFFTIALSLGFIILFFLLYQPYRHLVERLLGRLLKGRKIDTAQVVRSYSKAISPTLDVEQLSRVIIDMISGLLGTKRGALMLVSLVDDIYTIEPIPAVGQLSYQKKLFPAGIRLLRLLGREHKPLLQYDIDFNPDYAALGKDERDWLAGQDMEVYVPIVAKGELAGLIALGPKHSGRAYEPDELELVQVLADQTEIALQNARLYSAVQEQNEQIHHLNNDLLRQNERLEILDRIKSDFITIASHELRTPLTQIKGYANILQEMNEEQDLTREQIREILKAINRATIRLEKLLAAMLDASELEISGMELNFMQTRLDSVINLAVEPLLPAIQERNLEYETIGLDDLPPLQADIQRMVQAFHNLIGNAVKYTPDFGTITIEALQVPSEAGTTAFVEVIIGDTGIGINSEFHDLIFEKFFRIGDPELHSTGSTKFKGAGPGLGLHIARGVIEAHGGRIWVESTGQDEALTPGSCFHLVLPVVPPAAQQTLMGELAFAASEKNGETGRSTSAPYRLP